MRKWFCRWWNTLRFRPKIVKSKSGRYCPMFVLDKSIKDDKGRVIYPGLTVLIMSISSLSRANAERNLAEYLGERIMKTKDFD